MTDTSADQQPLTAAPELTPADAAADAAVAKARPRAARAAGDVLIQVIDQWPAHPTWKRWLFRVWDKRTRSRINECFDDGEKAKGWEWAEHQRALLNQGKTGAGPVLFEAVGMRYVDDLRKAGKSEAYIDEVERLYLAVVAAGADQPARPRLRADRARLARRGDRASRRAQAGPVTPGSHRPDAANLQARLARAEQLAATCPPKQRKRYEARLERWRARVARGPGRARAGGARAVGDHEEPLADRAEVDRPLRPALRPGRQPAHRHQAVQAGEGAQDRTARRRAARHGRGRARRRRLLPRSPA
jgi:hypothetical protein